MGVNAAAFVRHYVRESEKKLSNLLPSILGLVICLLLWLHLSAPAGIAFGVWKTKGFREDLVNFELPAEEETSTATNQ